MSHAQSRTKQSLKPYWLALSGLSAVFLFGMLDNSILNIALPTIGRELHTSATGLQWITSAYSIVFGGLMLAIGAISDRFGRRRVMLIGLALLAAASLLTIFVRSTGELIAVRMFIGIAASMTTPGTMALAFRLFDEDKLRIRAIAVITAVGLVGLASGPVVGGLLLQAMPWQGLLLINVPIAILAFFGILAGIAPDRPEDLHRVPVDVLGAVLGTLTIILVLASPTLFVASGVKQFWPWFSVVSAIVSATAFVMHERHESHPLLDSGLITQPLVSGGLAYKAATGLAIAGLGYIITLQLQLDWGWSPALASVAMLPQVTTLLLVGFFVERFVDRIGIHAAAWLGSLCVVAGMVIYATLGLHAYVWVALTLVLISAGLRVVGLVAGVNVMHGAPQNRTSIAAAMVDTTDEVTSAVSTAVVGTIIAALFVGDFTSGHWSAAQHTQFEGAATLSVSILAVIAVILILWAFRRTRMVVVTGRQGDANTESDLAGDGAESK
ncbi:MAG: MFS transporter [Bifidobacterium psychraerophilum]|uniref:MFS transporter n=1 Tax=Bifidobacterium psychraerophilum TaxID=218140 RepID=UPI0039E857E6